MAGWEIEQVGVVGAGTMGSGIAQVAARHGFDVVLYDIADGIVRSAQERILGFWDRHVTRGRMTDEERAAAIARLRLTTDIEDFSGSDLVIEAAPEERDLKRRILGDLERICLPHALLATNTSSLSVTDLSEVLQDPARFAGMHFFNPAPLMALVEVVRASATEERTVSGIETVARAMGKTPVRVADSPGFIVNRVARPFYLEALRILGEGRVGPGEIDAAITEAGFRMGPFSLMDLIGIDINLTVTRTLHAACGSPPRLAPQPVQERLVAEGKLGRKSGEGFFHYGDATRHDAEGRASGTGPERGWIRNRMLAMIVNEASFVLGEEVAGSDEIDTAMRLGTNWPRGPLAWGEEIGLAEVARTLDSLARDLDPAVYEPAPLLRRLAEEGARRFPRG